MLLILLLFSGSFCEEAYKNLQAPSLSIKDLQDPKKVQEYINKIRKPNQTKITILSNGQSRNFTLDENGKVIIPIKITLTQLYEYRLNWKAVEIENKYLPVSVNYDFEKMLIYPIVKDQCLTTFIDHRKTHYWYSSWDIRRKTSRYSQELILELGDNFVFKTTNSSRYVLRSPNVQPIYSIDPKCGEYKYSERVEVPQYLAIGIN